MVSPSEHTTLGMLEKKERLAQVDALEAQLEEYRRRFGALD